MKQIITAITILQLLVFAVKGQTVLRVAETNEIIPHAHILNTDGQIVGITGLDGIISIFPDNADDVDSISFEHISYLPGKTTIKDLNNQVSFFLYPEIKELPEISIFANKHYDFTVIKGYYRSYQLNEKTPVYYSDGIIEYYIPFNEKGKVKYGLHHNRSFKNDEYLNSEKNRSISLTMKTAGIFNYSHYWIPYLGSDYRVFTETGKDNLVHDMKNNIVGKVMMHPELNITDVYIDCLAPDTIQTHSLFGYTSVINQHIFSQRLHTKDIMNADIGCAESFKVLRQMDFKYKKDVHYTRIECIDEFYVIEIYRISKKEIKKQKLSSSYTLLPSSDTGNFEWLTNPQYNIPTLNHAIQKQLHQELVVF